MSSERKGGEDHDTKRIPRDAVLLLRHGELNWSLGEEDDDAPYYCTRPCVVQCVFCYMEEMQAYEDANPSYDRDDEWAFEREEDDEEWWEGDYDDR